MVANHAQIPTPEKRKPLGPARVFSSEDLHNLHRYLSLISVPLSLKVLYFIFEELGLRVAEVQCLTTGYFFAPNGEVVTQVTIPRGLCKGNCQADRTFRLSVRLQGLLKDHFRAMKEAGGHEELPHDLFLFPGREVEGQPAGKVPVSASTIAKRLKHLFEEALGTSEGYRTHSPRRTFATRLYKLTGNIKVVQMALGHKHVETTFRYIEIDQAEIDEATRGIQEEQEEFEKAHADSPDLRHFDEELPLGEFGNAANVIPDLNAEELQQAVNSGKAASLAVRQKIRVKKRWENRQTRRKKRARWFPGMSE